MQATKTHTIESSQPWLFSAKGDSVFILFPPFFCLMAVMLFPDYFSQSGMSVAWWVLLVLLIDVSDVYSTLFRTYFDKAERERFKKPLVFVPLISFFSAFALYYFSSTLFWTVLAYMAVYHFVRQQYGFFRLYSRKEKHSENSIIDNLAIYSSTLVPILYWHLDGNRAFTWFLEGDFLPVHLPEAIPYLFGAYFIILSAYILKEAKETIVSSYFNLPKNLLLTGTALSWFFGIVYFNSDLTFTLFNVISHGIPYIALIWMYQRKKSSQSAEHTNKGFSFYSINGIFLFLATIALFAFLEEGLWDIWVWNDNQEVFSMFYSLPSIEGHFYISLVVALLILPQLTHYILDGFIWKMPQVKKDLEQ